MENIAGLVTESQDIPVGYMVVLILNDPLTTPEIAADERAKIKDLAGRVKRTPSAATLVAVMFRISVPLDIFGAKAFTSLRISLRLAMT
jgi:hypothetical protein